MNPDDCPCLVVCFFICIGNHIILCGLRGCKKSTAEYAEAAEVFLGEDKKYKSFNGYRLRFAFRSSRIEEKKMNEEEAESAEIVS